MRIKIVPIDILTACDTRKSHSFFDKHMSKIQEEIIALLSAHGIPHTCLAHAPTATCAEAKKVRGDAIGIGTKSILLKSFNGYLVIAINSERKIDFKKLRKSLSIRKSRFATPEEMREQTSLVPGAMPPFGAPIFSFPLYADRSIFSHEKMAFNAGSLTHTIFVSTSSYQKLAKPEILDFAKPATEESKTARED